MNRWQIVGAALGAAGFLLVGSQLPAMAASHAAAAGASVSHPSGMLGVLANPTVAFVLVLIALLGVGLEVLHPGALVFGSVGVLAGVLAVAALINLPVNLVGLVVVGAAATLLVVDVSGQSYGVLSLAGVAAAIAGGLLLFRSSASETGVNLLVLITVPVVAGAIWVTLSQRALRVRHLPFATSSHELLGLTAVVREGGGEPSGIAAVEGELWRVVARDGRPLVIGSEVEVIAQDGLTLIVDPLPGQSPVSELAVGSGRGARTTNE